MPITNRQTIRARGAAEIVTWNRQFPTAEALVGARATHIAIGGGG